MEKRVQRAAAAEGISVSEFIRRAADERADQTLADIGEERLADVIGVVRSAKRQARRTGEAFAEHLAAPRRSAQ